ASASLGDDQRAFRKRNDRREQGPERERRVLSSVAHAPGCDMRTNLLAWVSLVLGVLAPLTCGATAPLALLLGYLALRRVNLSDGRVAGGRAARAAMILGGVGLLSLPVGLFVRGLYRLRGQSELAVC